LDTDSYVLTGHISEFVSAVHGAGAKAMVTMMGDSARAAAMQTCTDSGHINQFVTVITNFVNSNGYDGFDLDWEVGIDDAQFQDLVNRLRTAMPSKILTVAVTVTDRFNVSAVQTKLDQVNIMNYDGDAFTYTGPPGTDTWYNSALLAAGDTTHITAEATVNYYLGAGVAPGKIGIGEPFYARIKQGCLTGFLSGSTCMQNVTAPVQSYASGDALTNPRTGINYNALLNSVYWSSGTKVWDATHGAQYIQYNAGGANQAFVPYTGVEQIQAAVNYVNTNNLGGIMVYELSGEYMSTAAGDARYPLSTALYNAVFSGASNADLRTQLINNVITQIPVDNGLGIQVNGYATLMSVDQWCFYYSEIRAPIITDEARMAQLLDILGIPSTEPQRSTTLITVDQFIAALGKMGLGAAAARPQALTPSTKLVLYFLAVLLVGVAGGLAQKRRAFAGLLLARRRPRHSTN
jgi:hypothetical protein